MLFEPAFLHGPQFLYISDGFVSFLEEVTCGAKLLANPSNLGLFQDVLTISSNGIGNFRQITLAGAVHYWIGG